MSDIDKLVQMSQNHKLLNYVTGPNVATSPKDTITLSDTNHRPKLVQITELAQMWQPTHIYRYKWIKLTKQSNESNCQTGINESNNKMVN